MRIQVKAPRGRNPQYRISPGAPWRDFPKDGHVKFKNFSAAVSRKRNGKNEKVRLHRYGKSGKTLKPTSLCEGVIYNVGLRDVQKA